MPAPFEAVYGASKAFLSSFAQAIRNELKDTGVVVTALMPGATETNFFHHAGMEDTKLGASDKGAGLREQIAAPAARRLRQQQIPGNFWPFPNVSYLAIV